MSGPDGSSQQAWWLDPGLARLAFGTRQARTTGRSARTLHLAFLPIEALELDLSDPAQREFGDYELLEQIGQGGMGVVYRARQRTLEREVALKLLAAGPWASEEFVAGFRREARNAASLQHPNIVAIHEMGEQDGLIYYAMQLVRGRSLAQRLQEDGRLAPREAASLLRTVAEAVDYAHRLGVLHLDLKPGNILLDEAGTALVTDFGLARRLGQAPSVANEQVSGTPSYMAPEQAQVSEARLSAATDIWGMGAVLYESLTGVPPFIGDGPGNILQRVLTGTIRRPGRYVPLPRDLEAICLKCLSRSQAERYASARELADDLGRFLEHRAVRARPLNAVQRVARWARREPRFAAASVLAVMALTGGLAATTQQWQRAQENALAASERLWDSRIDAAQRLEAGGAGWEALWQLLQNAREQTQAGHAEAALDGHRRIELLLDQGASLIDAIALTDAVPLAVALSADGSRLAVALSDLSVRWYDTATLAERGRIALGERTSSGGQPRSIAHLRFIGNGHVVASLEWYRHYTRPAGGDAWLLDLGQGAVVEPPAEFGDFSDANFAPDGRTALLRSRDGRVQAWRTRPWAPLSPPVAAIDGRAAPPWLLVPGGRRAVSLDAAMRRLEVHDWPSLRPLRRLELPAERTVSAWAASPDGRLLALGDIEGRIALYTLDTGTLRALPSARGRDITWLDFSEDGAWLAAGGADGRVLAFEADSGDAITSAAMEHDFPVWRVAVHRGRRLLLVAGEGRWALWRMPTAGGPRALPALRVGLPPAAHGEAAIHASGWSFEAGLMASAGIDGALRLWRLPASATIPATLPPQLAERSDFDGRHVVDTAWDRLRIVTLDGSSASGWITLPQPAGFAELVGDGRTLVLTTGPELQVRGLPSLALRRPPIALPASPQRLLASPDGRYVLLAFAAPDQDGFAERLLAWDLADGRRLPGEAVLRGPLLSLAWSADGNRIVAVGPAEAATSVLGTGPLRLLGEYRHDPCEPVVAADFAANGRDLLLLLRSNRPPLCDDALVVWDPDAGAGHLRLPIAGARPYAVVAVDGGAFIAGERHHLVFDGARLRPVPRPKAAFDSRMGAVAISPDHRLLALGSLRGVQLYAVDGTAIGAPLRIDTPGVDGIAELAFSGDGTRLLARTVWGAAQWRVSPGRHTDAGLDALLASLGIAPGAGAGPTAPTMQHRAALRTQDPGPWAPFTPRPQPALAGRAALDGSAIPARRPGTPPALLDLTAVYATGPDSERNSQLTQRPFLRPYPAGVQRMGGIDFDIRGMAEVRDGGFGRCLPVPAGLRAAAVHALLVPTVRTAEPQSREVARLVLHYADGGQARAPIRTGQEVPGFAGADEDVRQVFTTRAPRAAMGLRAMALAAPRLANPEPARPLRCLDLRSSGDPLLVMGITIEPPPAAAVTFRRNSR